MTTKLISANMGMKLVLDVDGRQEMYEFSVVCPSAKSRQPNDALFLMWEFLTEKFGVDVNKHSVQIARPAKIKAPKRVSQAEFNRRIKELQP